MVYQNATPAARLESNLHINPAASSAGTNTNVRLAGREVPPAGLLYVELLSGNLLRWCAPSMAWFLIGILLVQGFLFCSDRYEWCLFNKGYTVLVAVATTASALLLLGGYVLVSFIVQIRSQFSLATLFLMVPVAAVPCAWLAHEVDVAKRQRVIVESFRLRKMEPLYADDTRGIFPRICDRQTAAWLESGLGTEFFSFVTYVDMRNAADSDLAALAYFPKLDLLALDRGAITDIGLAHLQNHKHLRGLSLVDTQVTDKGLEHLKKLPHLEWVFLTGTPVTEDGAKGLRKALPQCKVVRSHWGRRRW